MAYENLDFTQSRYIPQYTGAPLDEIKQTADTLQNRHYQNIAAATQLDILASNLKSKALPGAKSYFDSHIQAIDEALGEMAKSGGERSSARVNALAQAFQSDQGVLNSLARAEEYNKQTSLIDELKAKGQVPLYDTARRIRLETAHPSDEVYNSPYAMHVEPYRDPTPEMEAIWKEINPDQYESSLRAALNEKGQPLATALANDDLNLFYETITSGGISDKKIKEQLDNAWVNYKNSQSYKQQVGPLVNKNEKQLKSEFLAKGLTRIFSNLQRDYKTLPASGTRAVKGEKVKYSGIGTVPAQIVKSKIPYNDTGRSSTLINIPGTATIGPGISTGAGSNISIDPKGGELTPEYVDDVKTASQVFNLWNLDPNSKEAQEAVKRYNKFREQRVSNTYAYRFDDETRNKESSTLQDEHAAMQYMSLDGKTITTAYGPDGNPTKEFVELTGGDPKSFTVESELDPKQHYASMQGAGPNFVRPKRVTAKDSEGKTHIFLASQFPSSGQVSIRDINTNAIYSATNVNPGKEVDLGQGVKAKSLVGFQLQDVDLAESDMQNVDFYPVEITFPDGRKEPFNSAEEAAEALANPEAFGLAIQPIYLNLQK